MSPQILQIGKCLLEKFWAKYFVENRFQKIDEAPFSVIYSDRPSRYNTPLNEWIPCQMQFLWGNEA